MSEYICTINGNRGRTIKLYDNKCEIITDVTMGSVLTGNATDGKKTIFYIDCVGVQFKKTGIAIGYLQFETPSIQMNNKDSNYFSENTFTFGDWNGSVSNDIMNDVYDYVVNRIEGYKYHNEKILAEKLPESLEQLRLKETPNTRLSTPIKDEESIRREDAKKKELLETAIAQTKKDGNKITVFLGQLDSYKKFSDIMILWDELGLSEESAYDEIQKELRQKVYVERMYGGNGKEISEFSSKWKAKLEI